MNWKKYSFTSINICPTEIVSNHYLTKILLWWVCQLWFSQTSKSTNTAHLWFKATGWGLLDICTKEGVHQRYQVNIRHIKSEIDCLQFLSLGHATGWILTTLAYRKYTSERGYLHIFWGICFACAKETTRRWYVYQTYSWSQSYRYHMLSSYRAFPQISNAVHTSSVCEVELRDLNLTCTQTCH